MSPRTTTRECSFRPVFLLLKVPLYAILVSTIVAAGWVTAWIFRMQATRPTGNYRPTANGIVYPCENPRLTVGHDIRLFVVLKYVVVIFLTLPAGAPLCLAPCANLLNLWTG